MRNKSGFFRISSDDFYFKSEFRTDHHQCGYDHLHRRDCGHDVQRNRHRFTGTDFYNRNIAIRTFADNWRVAFRHAGTPVDACRRRHRREA